MCSRSRLQCIKIEIEIEIEIVFITTPLYGLFCRNIHNKIICIKNSIKVEIYTCIANKNIYMGNTVLKKIIQN